MIALMTRRKRSAAVSRAAADHAYQRGSSVARSSRTLLSTITAVTSITARQRHNFVGGHANVGASAQMGDNARSSSLPLRMSCWDYRHDLAVELEINLGVRPQAGLLADFRRDSHLAFRCDSQRFLLTLTSKSKTAVIDLQVASLSFGRPLTLQTRRHAEMPAPPAS